MAALTAIKIDAAKKVEEEKKAASSSFDGVNPIDAASLKKSTARVAAARAKMQANKATRMTIRSANVRSPAKPKAAASPASASTPT